MDAELASLAGSPDRAHDAAARSGAGREADAAARACGWREAEAAGDADARLEAGIAAATGPGHGAAAVTELFRDHHLELVRLAVMMTGDLATAEDVVQDVYERLHRRWPALSSAGGLAYARASVLNGCRSAHRRAVVRRRHAASLAGRAEFSPDAGSAAADRGILAAALRRLPSRQREVLVLRYYCDLDIAEIALMLRIGPSAVRSTMSRGLAALARTVGE